MNLMRLFVLIFIPFAYCHSFDRGPVSKKLNNSYEKSLPNDTTCKEGINTSNTFYLRRFCYIRYSDSITRILEEDFGSGRLKRQFNVLFYDDGLPLKYKKVSRSTFVIEVYYMAFKDLVVSGAVTRNNGDTIYLNFRPVNGKQFNDKEMDTKEEAFFKAIYEVHSASSNHSRYVFILERGDY